MAADAAVIPPPPPGFTMDGVPPPPPGFVLDGAAPVRQPPTIREQILDAVIPMIRPGGMGNQINHSIDRASDFAGETVNDISAKVIPPEAAAGLGVAAKVGVQAAPMLLGGEWAKKAAPAIRSTAEGLMQSALKPSVKAMTSGKGGAAVSTLLDEGINVSKGGIEKLTGMIDDLNNTIGGAIKGSTATVDKGAVASRIQDVVNRIERSNSTPQDALAEVEKVYSQFVKNKIIPDRIPVAWAQELKQGIYRVIGEKYGTLGSDWVEAQKALARGYKEEIASAVPVVSGLNAKESELINALNLLQRRVAVAGNKNPIGLGWLNPNHLPAWLLDRSEIGKSIAARTLNAGQEQIPATAARVGIAGFETLSRDKERNKQNQAR